MGSFLSNEYNKTSVTNSNMYIERRFTDKHKNKPRDLEYYDKLTTISVLSAITSSN